MNFDQIIAAYAARGIVFATDELEELKDDTKWIEQCDWCEECGVALLHDDEVYTDKVTGEWLCENCCIQHEDGTCSKIK